VGARQVQGSWRAGSAGRSWRGRVRRRYRAYPVHVAILTDDSKSQLAIQYAHSIRDAAPQTFVFWVHASTYAQFEEAYRDIADRLQLLGKSDSQANVLRQVSNWLRDETNGHWVMVLDNVDDIETFFPSRERQRDEADTSAQIPLATYLPQSRNGAILVTSRSKDAAIRLAGGYNKTKEVLAMDESEGLQLLRNKLQHPPLEESAVELLQALDCIPLAISQAAAYINRRARMTVAGYLSEFRRNKKKQESLLNWSAGELRRDEGASNSVVMTWQISFERVRQERPSAAELLSLMSFFNPQSIPESTLRRYSEGSAEVTELDDGEADSRFDEDLDTLQTHSLVSMTTDNAAYKMHALVQFCMRVWLSSFSDAEQWEQEFISLMAAEFPTGQYENWAKCEQLLPHVKPLFESKPAAKETLKAWAQVLTNAAWYLWLRGSYSSAQQIAARALSAREGVLGLNSQQTLVSVEVLAGVLQAQGKYKEAEELSRRALEGYEKELGEQHPSTLTSVSNLASVLQAQGRYKETEELSRRALEGCEKELGEQHPSTLTSVSNLASVLQAQGRYEEAERLSRRALEGYEKELGDQHPSTLTSVSNLASVLQAQGRYEEAERLSRRALEGYEKELGEQHPSTLTRVSNLASVLQAQGRYEEAQVMHRQTLAFEEKVLGPEHPSTLTSMYNLAEVLKSQGKYKEAKTIHRQTLAQRETVLGPKHLDTLTSVYCLAHLLAQQRRYTEAFPLYKRACAGYQAILGKDHPTTHACQVRFESAVALKEQDQLALLPSIADNSPSTRKGKRQKYCAD
jgi:tetratricopeptide (TPR) repeat protein